MPVDFASILDSLGPNRRYADPEAPTEARLMAASGLLPLQPAEIAMVLFALTGDPDSEVKERASNRLESLPDQIVDATLAAAVHPALLAWLAGRFREDAARCEKLALNVATSDETIAFLATLPFPNVVDIIANNQTRLLRCPALLDALGENPLTGQATIDRILHFLGLRKTDEEETDAVTVEAEKTSADDTPAEEGAPQELPGLDDPAGLPTQLIEEPPEAESEEAAEERGRSLHTLVTQLNVIEKMRLARLGNAEARGLLIRDPNRLVATAAIRSPKLTESEIIGFARARNISEEILRIISNNREWTRIYAVQQSLATNPKTPVQAAIKFLNFLTDRDLKAIMRSREVPGPVSVQARRILARKGKT